jgi:hypothetical protein
MNISPEWNSIPNMSFDEIQKKYHNVLSALNKEYWG